jgi:hypothetical protein
MNKSAIAYTAIPLIIASIFFFSACSSNEVPKESAKNKASVISEIPSSENKSNNFRFAMNKLWEDHIIWTRNVILCLVDSVPGADQAVKRLMQNQVDIGNAIKPYYGVEDGNKLTDLLKTHVAISANVVISAKAGNKAALKEANKKWFANADEIGVFLCNANPHWVLTDMQLMNADVIAYDKVQVEILNMSTMIADGIVKQFPEKFNASSNH